MPAPLLRRAPHLRAVVLGQQSLYRPSASAVRSFASSPNDHVLNPKLFDVGHIKAVVTGGGLVVPYDVRFSGRLKLNVF